jgi:hypothetical protein
MASTPALHPRPSRVTLLAWLLMFTALWNGLRLLQAIRFASVLDQYHSEPGSWYIAASGGIWLLAGGIIALGLLRGQAWAWFTTFLGTAGYAIWVWLDRLILQKPHANWPFSLALTVILVTFFYLLLLSRKTIRFFAERTPASFRRFRLGQKFLSIDQT